MKRLSRPWRVGFSVLGAVLLALLMPLATSSGVALAQASSSVDLSPAQGPPGILVTATGSGWAAGDSIQAIWGSDTGPYVGSTATVNSNGGFTLTFAVPSGTAAGSYQVFFYDETERYFEVANENFVVTQSSGSAPAAPSNLKVTPDGPLDFYITWTSNSTNQTGFQIYNGGTAESVGANQTSYVWAVSSPSTYMCFAVRAYNSSGSSSWAGVWTCATTPAGGIPAAPTNVVATPYSSSAIEITLVNQANNETGFYIYNGVTTETLNAPNMPAKGQGIAILWTGLAPNTYMCIKVAAYNQWGSSAYVPSSWTCATTPASWAGSGFCARYSNAPYTGETWNGVAACGNPYPANNQGDISYNGVTFDTVGFQCVELAARYFYYVTGKIPPTPARGSDFVYDLNSEYGYSIYPTGSRNGTSAFQNSIKPGNIISMWSTADPVGHVGVVISVNVTNGSGTIKIMDENGSGTGTDTINVQKGTMSYPYAANESYNSFQWTTNMPAPTS
jgi:CHAP domain-containing protein